jgi:hypothetical protein
MQRHRIRHMAAGINDIPEEISMLFDCWINYGYPLRVIRGDNSILVTVMNHRELWYIPLPSSKMWRVDLPANGGKATARVWLKPQRRFGG